MFENKFTKPNYTEKVVRVDVMELHEGDFMRPRIDQISDSDDGDFAEAVRNGNPVWAVVVHSQAGFEDEQRHFIYFAARAKAEEFRARNAVGSTYQSHAFLLPSSDAFEVGNLSSMTKAHLFGRGEPKYSIVYDVLHGAGLYRDFKPSKELLEWVGQEGQDWLKEEYGENWTCVAIMEYCVRHFHPTSMAFIAARVLIADFVAVDDFDAGYASRELEVLSGGAVTVASKARAAQKRRTDASSQISRKKREERLEALLGEIEKLAVLVPKISEARIMEQAWDNLEQSQSGVPKTPKIRFEYEVTLRSEQPYKTRFDAVFRKGA